MLALFKNTFKEKLYEHIKLREGYKEVVYLDSLGKMTGGIGHLLNAKDKKKFLLESKIPKEIIEDWYEKDIEKSLDACNEQCKILNLYDKDFKIALTSVNFQLGTKWFRKFPKTWHALCHKEYDNAIAEITYKVPGNLEHSDWYKQTPVRVKDFAEAIENIKESI